MKYILLIITILTLACTSENKNAGESLNEEMEANENSKADEMLKRDKERYDSMKNAILQQTED